MKTLRVLMVEDSGDDALLVTRALRAGGYDPDIRRVETAEALRQALGEHWDVVISDYALPRFDGLSALRIVREVGGTDLPFVLVSGTIGEERAVAALKSGAGDFVTKQNLARLVPAIERELADAEVRRERRQTLEQLEAAVSARDQFLSIASHELRTPLTSLQLQVQSLLRMLAVPTVEGAEPAAATSPGAPGAAPGAGHPRMEQKLKTVCRSTERLSELVNRLLDVSRITSGNPMQLEPEPFDLAELVREVVARFGDALRERSIEVRMDAPTPVPGTWDRMRLDTVVTNLLSNAIKYGEGRPIDVQVTREGGVSSLAVRDHGIGIHPADQARIFGRFERAVPERHYGGFGIGLWVARLVAEAHGGRLRVTSEPGQGATFTLELPPAPPAPEAVPEPVPGTVSEADDGAERRSGQSRTGGRS